MPTSLPLLYVASIVSFPKKEYVASILKRRKHIVGLVDLILLSTFAAFDFLTSTNQFCLSFEGF